VPDAVPALPPTTLTSCPEAPEMAGTGQVRDDPVNAELGRAGGS